MIVPVPLDPYHGPAMTDCASSAERSGASLCMHCAILGDALLVGTALANYMPPTCSNAEALRMVCRCRDLMPLIS